ncbi:DMT family transporter [Cnuibacter sp. UC19_7]|uniref:DMT family transporter n=1 Tax=Cnuibacter sp. UC19_7 TaxID=3350166 RepID=UPI00366EC40F
MEATWRWAAITAVAPIAWGATYFVTLHLLPHGYPFWGGALRALPAGLILLAVTRRLPRGSWWWRSLVLGTLNMGAFFALVYVAAQLLPTSIASTVMALSPVPLMLLGWALLAQRPAIPAVIGAALGIVGVVVMLAGGGGAIDGWGLAASLTAMLMSSVGFVLARRWSDGVDALSLSAWQLIAGGLVLLPPALLLEGAPPPVDAVSLGGFAFVSIVAGAIAFACWFSGLKHLDAGVVGLIGLLNPATGVVLGTVLAGESFTARQVVGLCLVAAGVLLGQPALSALIARLGRRRETETLLARTPNGGEQ